MAHTEVSYTLTHHEGTLKLAKNNGSTPRRNKLASDDVDDETGADVSMPHHSKTQCKGFP